MSHHHPLVIMSAREPTGSMADISGPKADKGTDMKNVM